MTDSHRGPTGTSLPRLHVAEPSTGAVLRPAPRGGNEILESLEVDGVVGPLTGDRLTPSPPDEYEASYKLLEKGTKVDGEIARTVPGTDLIMMFSCLR